MRTAGGEEAPSSAQVEAAAAAVAVELRFYHLGNNGGIKAMGTLELCGGSPATLQGNADATTFLDEGTGGTEVCRLRPGLHIGVVEGGEIKDLARLSSFVANPVFATGEEVEVAKGEVTDEAKKSVAEGEEDKLGEEAEGEKEEKAEGEKEEKAEGEERSEEEEEEGKKMLYLKVQVRIWPGSSRAILSFFYGGCWILTRAYRVHWLRENHKMLLLTLINRQSQGENHKISSHWSKACTSRLDFKGPLLRSNSIKRELNSFLNHFAISKLLGSGATCEVYQCAFEDDLSFQFAVKRMKVNEYYNEEPREVDIMSCLDDPSVLKFFQAWTEQLDGSQFHLHKAKYVHIHMEICVRTLREFLYDGSTQLTIEEKWALFENIAKCVEYLHLNGVIHRDLKPNNIFIGTDGGIKIGDFGHSCWIKNGEKGSQDLGTLMYTAPELRTGISTEKVDIYSIGVIYLEVFLPINARFNGLYNLMGRSYNPGWVDFGVDMELLMRLTSVHPSDRPSITEILEYINDRH